MLRELGTELRHATRRLLARPGHTSAVIAIFAVGCGTSLTVFRLADAVLLHALPYRAAERIIHVGMRVPVAPTTELPYSDVGYRALEKRTRTLDLVASYRVVGVNLTLGDRPTRAISARVTGNFFNVLGLPPQRGRLFHAGEETAHEPVQLVLTDAFWRTSFGANPNVIGTVVRVDGAPGKIIGVADPRVAFPAANIGYFTLMDLDPVGTRPFELGIDVIARMRAGVSVDAARKDATRIAREVAHENPSPHRTADSDVSGFEAIVRPLHDDMARSIKPTLTLLAIAVFLVLALTCVNVAALELVRSSAGRMDLAIRSALGADRARLTASALLEGALQAAVAGAVGLALSGVAIGLLESLAPSAFGSGVGGGITTGTAVATLIAALVCTAASVTFPIATILREDVQSLLRSGAGATTVRLVWLRRALVVVQIGFACSLVYGAAIMIATVRDAQRAPLGFDPKGVVLFNLNLPPDTYAHGADVSQAFQVLTDRLRAVPGVRAVGLASHVPLAPAQDELMIGVEGRVFKADGTDPAGDLRVVTPGYFETMGVRIVKGRAFQNGDNYADGTPAVISQTMAKVLWPDGTDPVGRRVRTGPFAPWMTIVGVVSDVRNRSLTLSPRAEVYLPFGAPLSPVGVSREMTFVLRTDGGPNVQRDAQRAVMETNRDLPLYGVTRYEEIIDRSQLRQTMLMRALSGFAAIALLLAAAGSYALLMFAVVQRRRELAVRQAVGASAMNVAAMIARETAELVAGGVVVGLAAAWIGARLLAWALGPVSAIDPRAAIATIGIMGAMGCVAALVPARRAANTDPMLVIRGE